MMETIVSIQPGKDIVGGTLTLTGAAAQQLTTLDTPVLSVQIRSALSNAIVYILEPHGYTRIGYLSAGDSQVISVRNPSLVYLSGTLNNVVYWMAVTK